MVSGKVNFTEELQKSLTNTEGATKQEQEWGTAKPFRCSTTESWLRS